MEKSEEGGFWDILTRDYSESERARWLVFFFFGARVDNDECGDCRVTQKETRRLQEFWRQEGLLTFHTHTITGSFLSLSAPTQSKHI
mmetsp:Transcript_4204/g.15860  ORF Transcript_4204/g.15860 Transcript_4204/m.15860 type:complete len:87 (+) Transcript_4204:1961-2221(+)